ncbi:MAG TPA: UDP-3-O-(3-hydroxymyristoyl)glucosamine N-acyltransferase [Steroidobacteraceae bacterium]|jgi:UDP-3-O-[3-hydroxymyristoyl] glucosamine N-acyltransferase
MVVTLGELAVRFGCELRGDPLREVDCVGTLLDAHPRAITFLAESRHRAAMAQTKAAAVVVEARFAAGCPVAALIASNPRATYARIATWLYPPLPVVPGIHPSAIIAADAQVDPSAHVGALAVIGAGTRIGAGALIGPHCVIGAEVSIAAQARLVARVTLCDGVCLGARSVMHPGSVAGSEGFGFAPEDGAWLKIPQVGGVRIGADVEIGANTTIDRGAIGDTVIEDGVKLDNLIQIGHNVRLGAHTAIAGCTGISGSTLIGERCQIGGAVGIGGHLSITDDVIITGFSMISHSIPKPGVYSSGIPFEEARTWRRMVARFKRLSPPDRKPDGHESKDD